PLYGGAGVVCVTSFRSGGNLSVLTAPPRMLEEFIPRVDASRVSQPDELVRLLPGCGVPAKANRVSSAAMTHRTDAIRRRRLKKAERRGVFIFVGFFGEEAQIG